MPGGHGGGKGKPLAQRTPGELWTDVAILAAGANFFVAVPFVGQPRPGLVKYLALPLVEVIFGVVALAVAPVIAELARRGDRVPAWAGRRPYVASFALINAVAVLTATVGFVGRAVADGVR